MAYRFFFGGVAQKDFPGLGGAEDQPSRAENRLQEEEKLLQRALIDMQETLHHYRIMPCEPTPPMLAAAVKAGAPDEETALRIYEAMRKAFE